MLGSKLPGGLLWPSAKDANGIAPEGDIELVHHVSEYLYNIHTRTEYIIVSVYVIGDTVPDCVQALRYGRPTRSTMASASSRVTTE